jgi:hypothetical protein
MERDAVDRLAIGAEFFLDLDAVVVRPTARDRLTNRSA